MRQQAFDGYGCRDCEVDETMHKLAAALYSIRLAGLPLTACEHLITLTFEIILTLGIFVLRSPAVLYFGIQHYTHEGSGYSIPDDNRQQAEQYSVSQPA